MADADIQVRAEDLELDPASAAVLARGDDKGLERNIETLRAFARRRLTGKRKVIHLRFQLSPLELQGTARVERLVLALVVPAFALLLRRLDGYAPEMASAPGTATRIGIFKPRVCWAPKWAMIFASSVMLSATVGASDSSHGNVRATPKPRRVSRRETRS